MHPELFNTGVFIGDFSLIRSPWRGATTEADNNNVDTASIKIINGRRKSESARGTEVGLSMRQVYTHVYIAVVASLRLSQSH